MSVESAIRRAQLPDAAAGPMSRAQEDRRILTAEVKRLQKEQTYLREENKFLRAELTKLNNIIQPLWINLRHLREDFHRNPQTGEAAEAAGEKA